MHAPVQYLPSTVSFPEAESPETRASLELSVWLRLAPGPHVSASCVMMLESALLCCSKSLRHSAEEAIQCLGASDALAEDPALAQSTHARQLTPPLTPDPGPLTCSLASRGTCTHTHTAIYIYTHTHNQQSKLEEKYQTMQLKGVFIWAHHPLWQGRHNRSNHRPADLITSALGKQREVNAGDQLVFSFSSCQGTPLS